MLLVPPFARRRGIVSRSRGVLGAVRILSRSGGATTLATVRGEKCPGRGTPPSRALRARGLVWGPFAAARPSAGAVPNAPAQDISLLAPLAACRGSFWWAPIHGSRRTDRRLADTRRRSTVSRVDIGRGDAQAASIAGSPPIAVLSQASIVRPWGLSTARRLAGPSIRGVASGTAYSAAALRRIGRSARCPSRSAPEWCSRCQFDSRRAGCACPFAGPKAVCGKGAPRRAPCAKRT